MSRELNRARAEAAARAELERWVNSFRGRLLAMSDEVERVLNEVRAAGSLLETAVEEVAVLKLFNAMESAEKFAAGVRVWRTESDGPPDPVEFARWLASDLGERAGAA